MRSQEALHRRGRNMSNGTPPPGVVVIPPDPDPEPDNDPDTAEELAETLAGLTTHVSMDAWVQDHEAFLPERPDTWTTMSLARKREWVVANYNFDAVEPEPLPEPEPEPEPEPTPGDTNVATDSDGDDGA